MTAQTNNSTPSFLDEDFREIEEYMKEVEESNHTNLSNTDNSHLREGFSVKGKVCMVKPVNFDLDNFPDNKEDISHHLAIALDDEESLAWYQKLARERRSDFLKNCLRITLQGVKDHKIKTTKAKYFSGIIKNRTDAQKRLENYKKKIQQRQSSPP